MKYRNWAGKGRQRGKVAAPGRPDVRFDWGQFTASSLGAAPPPLWGNQVQQSYLLMRALP